MASRTIESSAHAQNIIACIWDFDKTLISGYMQAPIFEHFDVDPIQFWHEVNLMPEYYHKRGIHVSKDTVYLNHLLSYIKSGKLKGLNNALLRKLGQTLNFFPGIPEFFKTLKALPLSKPEYQAHNLSLEHYIISTGLAEIIRGSAVAKEVDGIYGCEFIETPLQPGFSRQAELNQVLDPEISQIGVMVDNTIKTRFIFEINKGSNKYKEVDVNAMIPEQDRRIPFDQMIYIADGPSDVPVFSVIKKYGGRAYAVYDPEVPAEFAQNDDLLQAGRIDAYGPANYTSNSPTAMWLRMHCENICKMILKKRTDALHNRISAPPKHIHKNTPSPTKLSWNQSEMEF